MAPDKLLPCPCPMTDHGPPDPGLQIDFPAWPRTCPITPNLSDGLNSWLNLTRCLVFAWRSPDCCCHHSARVAHTMVGRAPAAELPTPHATLHLGPHPLGSSQPMLVPDIDVGKVWELLTSPPLGCDCECLLWWMYYFSLPSSQANESYKPGLKKTVENRT